MIQARTLGMVDLAELARLHREAAHPDRIADVFGDGVLLERFAVLANLRAAMRRSGHRFVPLHELPRIFEVLPLLLLPELLARRTIPYRENASVLLELADHATAPIFDELTFGDISPLGLVHHESAHALFFDAVQRADGAVATTVQTGTREAARLVEVLIESEGFSLGLDMFVGLLAKTDPRPSSFQLLSINAPPNQFPELSQKKPEVFGEVAALAARQPVPVLQLLCTGAYIANLRPRATNAVSAALFERVASLVGFPSALEEVGRELLSIGLSIDHAFRQRVAPTLFRHVGAEAEFDAVMATPLERALEPGGAFATHLSGAIRELGLEGEAPLVR